MSNWKLIQPIGAATLNLITNPSFETNATGWTTGGANTIAPSNNQNYKGVASALVTYQNNTALAQYAITFPAAASTYKLTAFVYVPANWDGGIIRWAATAFAGSTFTQGTYWGAGDPHDEWYRIDATLTVAADVVGTIYIDTDIAPTPTRTMYVDAVCVYQDTPLYTYWDGDQPGAEWLGTRHASVSRASGVTRRIGETLDLRDDFHCAVSERLGTGTEGLAITRDEFALLPGAQRNNTKQLERIFTLMCVWDSGQQVCDYHENREQLIAEIAHDAYPKDLGGWQQVSLFYEGGTTSKEIQADYEGDIGNTFGSRLPLRAWPLRWRASDPFFYALKDSGAVLDYTDADTFRYVARRSTRGTGQWNNLGLANNPNVGGTIYAVLYANDGTVYFGGSFQGWNAVAGDDFIVQYDPVTGAFNTVGAPGDINGTVFGLAETATGDIIAVGAFTQNLPTQPGDYVSRWDGTNWNAVGAPAAGAAAIIDVQCVIVRANGNYVVGGNFTFFANVANANYIAEWNGAAWIAPGGVLAFNGIVYALAERTNGNYYAGGAFTTVAGAGCLRLAEWNGTLWSQVSTGLNNTVWGMDYDPLRDELYVGGAFTQDGAAAVTLRRAVRWDNQAFTELGGGIGNNIVYAVRRAPDGEIWFGGTFTSAGTLTLLESVVRWTGSSWLPIDAELNTAGAPTTYAIDFSPTDPVVVANYNPYLGFSTSAAGTEAGLVIVNNPGTQRAFPQIQIGRVGGTNATVISIRNETTGMELAFDYAMLDREQIFINLDPTAKTVISNYRGEVPEALLSASDLGQWALLPGNNNITAFIVTDATIAIQLLWRAPYKSLDD